MRSRDLQNTRADIMHVWDPEIVHNFGSIRDRNFWRVASVSTPKVTMGSLVQPVGWQTPKTPTSSDLRFGYNFRLNVKSVILLYSRLSDLVFLNSTQVKIWGCKTDCWNAELYNDELYLYNPRAFCVTTPYSCWKVENVVNWKFNGIQNVEILTKCREINDRILIN